MSVHTRSSNQAAGLLMSVPVNCTDAVVNSCEESVQKFQMAHKPVPTCLPTCFFAGLRPCSSWHMAPRR